MKPSPYGYLLNDQMQNSSLISRTQYPAAYKVYRTHCQKYLSEPATRPLNGTELRENEPAPRFPEGTALLIPPQQEDFNYQQDSSIPTCGGRGRGRGRALHGRGRRGGRVSNVVRPAGKSHWILCLFTSWDYRRQNRRSPDVILRNTQLALGDLKEQLEELRKSGLGLDSSSDPEAATDAAPLELWSCKLNAGLFEVPWERTKGLLEESGLTITVLTPSE